MINNAVMYKEIKLKHIIYTIKFEERAYFTLLFGQNIPFVK